MTDWLEANRQWIFSGAGVAAIMVVVAVSSSAITFWLKARSERKSRKRLALRKELKQYRIIAAGDDDHLTVSYMGKPYESLCQFFVSVENIGSPSVPSHQLLFRFPEDAHIVDIHKRFSSQTLSADCEKFEDVEKPEHLWTISCLESGDSAAFTYFVDTKKPEDIKCDPRSVDDVYHVYTGSESESVPDARTLISYTALFVLVGAIPFIGQGLQAGVIIMAAPTIIAVVKRLELRPSHETSYSIAGVTVEDGGEFKILQE